MNIVAIDTAGPVIGLALRAGQTTRMRTERVTRGSETRLVSWAGELAAEAGITLSQLDGVAVSRGPGAFTGLRVGLATGLGFALAAGVPIWAIDSLTPRAHRADVQGPLLALLDARKSRVYAAWFMGKQAQGSPVDLPPHEVLRPGPFHATGEGACVYREQIETAGGIVVTDADHPAVDTLATLAEAALAKGEGLDPGDLRPLYIRAPDAKPRKQ